MLNMDEYCCETKEPDIIVLSENENDDIVSVTFSETKSISS